jgi:osmoprotectant transport system permease protein
MSVAATAALRTWITPGNPVLLALVAIATLFGTTGGFLAVAPNRLLSGAPVALTSCVPSPLIGTLAALAVLLLVLGFAPPSRAVHYLAAAFAGAVLAATLAAAGRAAAGLAAGAKSATAISLAAGFWVVFACAALALIDALRRAAAGTTVQLAVAALAAGMFIAMAQAGLLDALSLAREYAVRREVFAAAVVRHIALVVAAIVPAILIGVPLGVLALRRKRFEGPLFAVLNLLQTVPSIALFGLLLGPLAAMATAVPVLGALGVGGVGPAPAVIALTLYALLPVARNTLAGIGGVPPGVIDAARGMGMTQAQIFRRVEVPLALPVLLAGLRIVLVQTIGLTVVAALIGAGGLGRFVFDGLGQYATDLVLLGALPAIVMALAADFLLRLATSGLGRR